MSQEIEITKEEVGVDVFVTQEFEIKELGSVKGKKLVFLTDYQMAEANLKALVVKHESRVSELVELDVLSPLELKELKSITAELKSPKILINKYKSEGVSVLAHYSREFKLKWDALVDVTSPLEKTASAKIEAEKDRKENEKKEQERLAQEKEDSIRNAIDDFETQSMTIIQKMTIDSKDSDVVLLNEIKTNSDAIEAVEFNILLEKAQDRVSNAFEGKSAEIMIAEVQRIENLRIKEEADKAKDIADKQSKRLKELLPYLSFAKDVDVPNLGILAQIDYDTILCECKALFEADAKAKKKEQDKKDAEAKAEKDALFELRKQRFINLGFVDSVDSLTFKGVTVNHSTFYSATPIEFEELVLEITKQLSEIIANEQALIDEENAKKEQDAVFEIRKSRLLEIGVVENDGNVFEDNLKSVKLSKSFIYGANNVSFEDIVIDCKQSIQEAKDKAKKAKEQEAEDLRLSLEDAKKLKLENEARIKRLANDKKNLSDMIDTIGFKSETFTLENEEIKGFLEVAIGKVAQFKTELLTELENL